MGTLEIREVKQLTVSYGLYNRVGEPEFTGGPVSKQTRKWLFLRDMVF